MSAEMTKKLFKFSNKFDKYTTSYHTYDNIKKYIKIVPLMRGDTSYEIDCKWLIYQCLVVSRIFFVYALYLNNIYKLLIKK